ncbi:MAG: hypothetical protein GY790_13175 [Bacteroidetes bacterium]|nr:hypothetical protein [Bacteroidota bacterium]
MKIEGKVIGVGFQKTGTSSLREALKILGFRVKDTSTTPPIPILKGDYEKVLRMIGDYDALEDTPWYMIYRELDERIPGSKFILTTSGRKEKPAILLRRKETTEVLSKTFSSLLENQVY